jgi:serine/threonine-protein kinase
MRIIPKMSLAIGLAAALFAPAAARAASPTDQATAVALFQEAKTLVAAGDYERACPKFAEAQRLFPTPGTALSVGDCFEKAGRLASAWGAFKEAEIFSRNAGASEHQAEAQKRVEALTPRLSRLVLVVPPTAKAPGFEVRRDGAVVGEAQWGSPVPVDPGWHKIEATAPGRKPWTTSLRVEPTSPSTTVEVPVLEAESTATQEQAFWGGQRIAGAALGGAGVASMIVGAVFAAKAAGRNSDSLPHCLPNDVTKCDATGVSLRNDAFTASHISTGMFVAGGVLVAGGLVVFLTAPRKSVAPLSDDKGTALRVSPLFGPGVAGVTFTGAW